ncbi:uncharacterized protein LOC129602227 [Paramacrobiotus metropolitanus]|uniref:uncharacterized protein LOC129602227 n=1 Tax=Paramacrobiotus metropolitanus TaxID=2943436 RepID=UPI0024461C07|nr:uncharacterized protein LOC129602227 [Paramacrobiotus metropolitanus]
MIMEPQRKAFRWPIFKIDTWAYQEILMEAIVVLWFAIQISFKFGLRVLPDWQTSRVDPSVHAGLDWLLDLIGIKLSGCAWDDIVAIWMETSALNASGFHTTSIGLNSTHSPYSLFAYAGAIATVCATALLGVSVAVCLLFNLHWKSPPNPKHDVIPFWHGSLNYLSLLGYAKWLQPHASTCWPSIWRAQFMLVLLVMLMGWIVAIGILLLWTVAYVLVVVSAMGVVAAVSIGVMGVQAVYPCCVFLTCFLALHCTGRIWGLWMDQTYSDWLCRKIRKGSSYQSFTKTSIPETSLMIPDGKFSRPATASTDETSYAAVVGCFVGCIAVAWNIYHVFVGSHTFAATANYLGLPTWAYWISGNGSACSATGITATGLGYSGAMWSYWEDMLLLPFARKRGILLVNYPAPSSWGASLVFQIWTVFIMIGSMTPLLAMVLSVFGVVGWMLFYGPKYIELLLATRFWESEKGYSQEHGTTGDPPPYTAISQPPEIKSDAENKGQGSLPLVPAGSQPSCQRCSVARHVLVFMRQMMCWVWLPFPATQFFMGEKLQLPGMLVLLTIYLLWIFVHLIKETKMPVEENTLDVTYQPSTDGAGKKITLHISGHGGSGKQLSVETIGLPKGAVKAVQSPCELWEWEKDRIVITIDRNAL